MVFCLLVILESTELLEDGNVVLVHLLDGVRAGLLPGGTDLFGALVEAGSLFLTGSFELLDDGLVLPAHLGEHITEDGAAAFGLEALTGEGLRDDHAGTLVGDVHGDTFVGDEAAEGGVTALGAEGEHTADDTAEDVGGRALVEGTLLGVGEMALSQEVGVLDLVADFLTGDVDFVGADDGDLSAEEELLGNDGGGATKDVVLEVDDGDVGAVSLSLLAEATVNVLTRRSSTDVADHFLIWFGFVFCCWFFDFL